MATQTLSKTELAHSLGFLSAQSDLTQSANPFDVNSEPHEAWVAGWSAQHLYSNTIPTNTENNK